MKQYITKEQWGELSLKNKNILNNYAEVTNVLYIGEMIEFLGDDLYLINHTTNKWWVVLWENGEKLSHIKEGLVDALWEAVKYKINI